MAFNKNKALESALKYLNQGKFAQAIGEYQQILRYDPKDQATLMTVGDLFARQSDMTRAVEYFERLANVYLEDGFNSKAIAIYKKIAKLAPSELGPLERLAELYVQQGVLSEARPLFLQMAEVHLKANRSQRAVEVLQRLLAVEPDNPRVQMRLAELYNIMGQKKEAAQAYLAYAQRLVDHGETSEAEKVLDRALEVEPSNAAAILLKAKALAAAKDYEQAVKVLGAHPEADAGGEVTDLIVGMQIESGKAGDAIDRARKQLARDSKAFAQLLRITESAIAAGKIEDALELLRELREPMIEAGEQEQFIKALTMVIQESPDPTESLELMADFCRHTSDPFRLHSTLAQLSEVYASQGNYARAEELLNELIDRNKGDERVVQKLNDLKARSGGVNKPSVDLKEAEDEEPSQPLRIEPTTDVTPVAPFTIPLGSEGPAEPKPAPTISDQELDEETQKYVAQALTDVDLFSSYGLTQKATHLLENVLQRAPRHTPTLERLLDLYLGAGNEKRTAETAAVLEEIYKQRGDTTTAEHFTELRKRFQRAAGLEDHELPKPAAPPPPPVVAAQQVTEAPAKPAEAPAPAASHAPMHAEFEIPLTPLEPAPEEHAEQAGHTAPVHEAASTAHEGPAQAEEVEEVDLSDEWEAMARDRSAAEPQAASAPSEVADLKLKEVIPEPEEVAAEQARAAAEVQAKAEKAPEETTELAEEPATEIETPSEGDFKSAPEEAAPERGNGKAATTDDFISQLVAEIDEAEEPPKIAPPPHKPTPAMPKHEPAVAAKASTPPAAPAAKGPSKDKGAPIGAAPAAKETAPAPRAPATPAPPVHAAPAAEETVAAAANAETLNELEDIFQEFRSELGEIDAEEEDLETHYNLGIAYREMGLLDEAIGEFQRVAKALERGKPFPYAMNCATFLALSFMDKGQAKVASFWYQRALETPGLDQETKLALRYDLAVAQESAGESKSALDSFQQVYAMNIDYRDVADRITALQKHPSRV